MRAGPSAELASRLRELREAADITQKDLAAAFGVSPPSVSSWENPSEADLPEQRLAQYAAVFSAREHPPRGRWRGFASRVVPPEEEDARRRLHAELVSLRSPASGAPGARPTAAQEEAGAIGSGPWHFPDGGDIIIVCAEFDPQMRASLRYADPADPDFVAAYKYADLDSLIELFGHIRATNPSSDVRFKLDKELTADDYSAHLALLGGVDWNHGTRRLLSRLDHLPVRQVGFVDNADEAGFEVRVGGKVRRYRAKIHNGRLLEDVAQFVRGPNPFNHARTFTICNGMFGRGTFAAVRALTYAPLRGGNAAYVRDIFPADTVFSLLFRVVIFEGEVPTPDWTNPDTVLHRWSEVE
ncbi:helix-turn-helix transcriptional regulator [Phytohabitans sp. ZYX-F-186]|uniref:Helix-turn-helix transcriptional regulator n=1 Tax=Phytohabitans maris TaxID=3071409 RepID=A0ABU0Z9Z4_9ACTN|nr:helix-turn-helix transcriptional regulator [Phytohabitans sp. ZYX-F-186]MDQ7903854.1 helix-turn-helix transcriptional regulator [Phytohabitans sp. ZYX-F-186]